MLEAITYSKRDSETEDEMPTHSIIRMRPTEAAAKCGGGVFLIGVTRPRRATAYLSACSTRSSLVPIRSLFPIIFYLVFRTFVPRLHPDLCYDISTKSFEIFLYRRHSTSSTRTLLAVA